MPRAMPCRALIFSCHAFISRAVLSRIRVAPLCDVPCRAMSIRLQRRSLPQRAVPCRAIMLRILWRAVATMFGVAYMPIAEKSNRGLYFE